MLATSEVNRVFEPQSGQTKDISYFSAKHAPLRNKKKGWLASIIKIQLSVLVYYNYTSDAAFVRFKCFADI
jgi:hypothetical protein